METYKNIFDSFMAEVINELVEKEHDKSTQEVLAKLLFPHTDYIEEEMFLRYQDYKDTIITTIYEKSGHIPKSETEKKLEKQVEGLLRAVSSIEERLDEECE